MYTQKAGFIFTPPTISHVGRSCVGWHAVVCYGAPEWYRPETPIRLGFRDMSTILYEDLVLHQVSPSVVGKDIRTFLQCDLSKIRYERNLPADWSGAPCDCIG